MNDRIASEYEANIDQALAKLALDQAESLAARYVNATVVEPSSADLARTPWLRARYLASQVALTGGKPQQALQHLQAVRAVAEQLPTELARRIWLLAAEAHARRQQATEARACLARLRSLPRLSEPQPQVWLRELRIRLWLGEVTQIERAVSDCEQQLTADPVNRALLLCEAGRAWDAAGDVQRAETYWRQAVTVCPVKGRCAVRADVLLQLGRLDHLHGRLQPALDHYDDALATAPEGTPQGLEIRLRRLLVLLDLNQSAHVRVKFAEVLAGRAVEQLPEEIRPLASTLNALLGGPTPDAERPEVSAYQAALRGDRQLARDLYRRAFQAEPAASRRARLALALGLLALDDPASSVRGEANAWLTRAEELARSQNLPEVLWRTLEGRGRVAAELEGDDDRARRYFEEAVQVSEGQVRELRRPADAAVYHLRRADLVRLLLRGAGRRGDAAALFRYQELERGRLLLDLWRGAARRPGSAALSGALAELDRRLQEVESALIARQQLRQQLERTLAQRDRLLKELLDAPAYGGSAGRESLSQLQKQAKTQEAELQTLEAATPTTRLAQQRDGLVKQRDEALEHFLSDRGRVGDAALPRLPVLPELAAMLPKGTVYVAPSLVGQELFFLVLRRGEAGRVVRVDASGLRSQLTGFWGCLHKQLNRYEQQLPLGPAERAEMDSHLDGLGEGSLGQVFGLLTPGERLLWVAEDPLHGLPLAALRRQGRYLIETQEVVNVFSGALVVHQGKCSPHARRWGASPVVTEAPEVLPSAGPEGAGVCAALNRGRLLAGSQATRAAVRRLLPRARVAHFACHAYFDAERPLTAHLRLPSGEAWHAPEWLDEPVQGLPLVTLSACRSAVVQPLLGREVFGLVTAILAGGVRAVLAGLWLVPDREAAAFMWRFYRHRLTTDLPAALALAQRDSLRAANSSPLFWAVFALFGDASALPALSWWWRWWACWQQYRHARRFPDASG